MRHKRALLGLAAAALCALLAAPAAFAADSEVLYVAGNPSLYPAEYYDAHSGAYEGALPALLEQVGEAAGLKFVYIHPGTDDQRAALAQNLQVELVSGLTAGDEALDGAGVDEGPVIFTVQTQDGPMDIRLGYTRLLGQQQRAAIEAAIAALPAGELAGLALAAGAQGGAPAARWPLWALGGLAAALGIALAAAVFLLRRARRSQEEDRMTDPATGLGNRQYFDERFARLVNDQNRILYCVVCFTVNLAQLRRFQDGREVEFALRYTADALEEGCREGDILARVGDDTFAVARVSSGPEELARWLELAMARLDAFAEKHARDYPLRAWAGAYFLQEGDRTPGGALLNAQHAAVAALEQDKAYLIGDEEWLRGAARERQFMHQTGAALQKRQFILYLHPVVDLHTDRVIGGEALIRWQHPERGLLAPGQFIGLMEREGTIGELDYYVMEAVCVYLEELAAAGLGDMIVSCNLSRLTLADPAFCRRAAAILDGHRAVWPRLVLEITEGTLSHKAAQEDENIRWLLDRGLALALDDFGSGYTSFQDLHTYPISLLKLDKGLLDCAVDDAGRGIVEGLIQFGHQLGVTVLCEGAEREDQVQMLRRMGCDRIQGYFFFQPMPARDAAELVLQKQAT